LWRQRKGKKHTKLKVRIPAGIDNGETISLRGEGEHGIKGGPSGDLFITIKVKPHPIFKRHGNDVNCEIPITFTQAALELRLKSQHWMERKKLLFLKVLRQALYLSLKGKEYLS